jgi:thioredoxin reductase (NADPH)
MQNPPDPFLERQKQMFPKLDAAQVHRLSLLAHKRNVKQGEVLIEIGAPNSAFFVVLTGGIEILRVHDGAEERIVLHGPGEFTGEMNMLSGRRSMFMARVTSDGEVLELDHDGLRRVVQNDSELSELFMRAYILRRVALIARNQGNATLVGSAHSPDTLHLREFLTRNSQPFTYIDVDRDPDVQPLLDRFHVKADEIPIVICRGATFMRNPTTQQLAECMGLNPDLNSETLYDMIVVGAGPSGLAAAVYGASEGLKVLVIETNAPGGQAGSSSKIENYLGFPTGISGQALAGRAYAQAQKFGAEMVVARGAVRLSCDQTPYYVEIDGGVRVQSRTIVIAAGAQYRRLPLKELPKFEGNGVYYGATRMEQQLCLDCEVAVVGGGNSAGQAAVFLAGSSKHVHMLVRSSGLADTMSRYLIRRIEDHPLITLHTYTEIIGLEGEVSLERVRWRDSKQDSTETKQIQHVFVMTGADPNTLWLDGCVARDDKGFVKTGVDLHAEDLAKWPGARPPFMLETSIPGVFAVGDVRSGSVKRVASAVGEGSICVQLIHKVIAAN